MYNVYNVSNVSQRHVSHVRAQNTEYLNIASHKRRLVRVFSHGDDKLHVAISAAQLCLVESPHQPQPSKQVPPQPGLGVKNSHCTTATLTPTCTLVGHRVTQVAQVVMVTSSLYKVLCPY